MKFKIPKQLKSRKLWLAIVLSIVTFGNYMWDWGLTQGEVLSIATPILAYIGIEGVADVAERIKE